MSYYFQPKSKRMGMQEIAFLVQFIAFL